MSIAIDSNVTDYPVLYDAMQGEGKPEIDALGLEPIVVRYDGESWSQRIAEAQKLDCPLIVDDDRNDSQHKQDIRQHERDVVDQFIQWAIDQADAIEQQGVPCGFWQIPTTQGFHESLRSGDGSSGFDRVNRRVLDQDELLRSRISLACFSAYMPKGWVSERYIWKQRKLIENVARWCWQMGLRPCPFLRIDQLPVGTSIEVVREAIIQCGSAILWTPHDSQWEDVEPQFTGLLDAGIVKK